jgi:hypothetical protein
MNHSIIAIPGLASNGFRTWKKPGSNFMWLRDDLPERLLGCRVIIYGYDSKLQNSQSFQDMPALSRRFTSLLEAIAPSFSPSRPIVMIGYSMGGLLLKKALVQMVEKGNNRQKQIFGSIIEVILFGVPNRGMEIGQMLAMVEGQPNEPLVRWLENESPGLEDLDNQFFDVTNERYIRILSIYETLQSRTTKVRRF